LPPAGRNPAGHRAGRIARRGPHRGGDPRQARSPLSAPHDRPSGSARAPSNLRAAIEWSYDQLTPGERDLFADLSIFEGGFTLESAASVCGGARDEFVVLDLFTRLLDKSLLVAETAEDGTPRHRYLETIREYALEKLALAATRTTSGSVTGIISSRSPRRRRRS